MCTLLHAPAVLSVYYLPRQTSPWSFTYESKHCGFMWSTLTDGPGPPTLIRCLRSVHCTDPTGQGAAVMQALLSSNLSPRRMATAMSGSMARAQGAAYGPLAPCRPQRASIGLRLLRSIRQVRTCRPAPVAAQKMQCAAAEQQLASQKQLKACLTAAARVVTLLLVMAVMPNKVLAAASAAGTGVAGVAHMLSVSPACKLGLASAALLAGPWLSKRRSRTLAPQVSVLHILCECTHL